MTLPNFIGLGAQRAATTWAYACLREHPEVFIPEQKEIGFFRWHYDKGLDWYASHFEGHAGEPAIGEITPGYMHSAEAIGRIATDLPSVRVFVVLREPVQRSFSAYQLLHERFCGMDFEDTLPQLQAVGR